MTAQGGCPISRTLLAREVGGWMIHREGRVKFAEGPKKKIEIKTERRKSGALAEENVKWLRRDRNNLASR
jgi:hypothetical protein